MIDYIKDMLNDKELDKQSKLVLLGTWKEKIYQKMMSEIIHSSELKQLNEVVNFIDMETKKLAENFG